jgi:hypothetical protein
MNFYVHRGYDGEWLILSETEDGSLYLYDTNNFSTKEEAENKAFLLSQEEAAGFFTPVQSSDWSPLPSRLRGKEVGYFLSPI